MLFEQLQHGIHENEDFIQLFSKRMELEIIYSLELETIQKTSSKSSNKRLTNDDYVSSIKNLFQRFNECFAKEGEYHAQVANSIKELVIAPFSKWCKEHEQRVEYSKTAIQERYKVFKSQKQNLEKLQKRYFNRCRMLEEFKTHYTEDEINEELSDAEAMSENQVDDENSLAEDDDEVYYLDGKQYDKKAIKSLLTNILKGVELSSHKIPILGTYNNVSLGSDITQWLIDNMPELKGNIARAEKIGQDLINEDFIRLIGAMNTKNFINSSQYYYQWKPVVFEITKLSEFELQKDSPDDQLNRSSTVIKSSQFADYLDDMKQALGVSAIDYKDRSQLSKLINEVNKLDSQYYQLTVQVDKLRCDLEEVIMDHLAFMQKCELDRVKAIKKVSYDFIACFSKGVEFIDLIYQEMVLIEETINPINDLKFLIDNYATGRFKPHVILYDNYYNSNIKQTFGVDLSVKSRIDRKVVPIIVQCILSYLDHIYPELENDEERIHLWTKPVHLSKVHQLRFKLNDINDTSKVHTILKESHPIIVTNVLKLYFMELPDSIIPHDYYDLIKSLYQNYPSNSSEKETHESRITGLQNVLVDLPKCNLATLDAILTHLGRLVNIIGSKDKEVSKDLEKRLAKEFSSLVLRPKSEDLGSDYLTSNASLNDKHQYNLLIDLFENKETIFKELRRRNSSRVSSASFERHNSSSSGPKEVVVEKSKKRLERKLQDAMHTNKNKETEDERVSRDKENGHKKNDLSISKENEALPPPPEEPKTPPSGLKRSPSPKKGLSSHLKENERKSFGKGSKKSSKKDDSGLATKQNEKKDEPAGEHSKNKKEDGVIVVD